MKIQCCLLEPGPHCQMSPSNQKFFPVGPSCSETNCLLIRVTSWLVLAQIEHADPYFSATWLSKRKNRRGLYYHCCSANDGSKNRSFFFFFNICVFLLC